MARPRKQTVDYFPHDTDASEKKTLTILQSKYGNDGYAFWFKLLELLGNTEGHHLDFNDNTAWEFLQAKTHLDSDFCTGILDLLARLGAIDADLWGEKIVWSQNFVNRVVDVYKNRRVETPTKPSFYKQKPQQAGVSTNNNLPLPPIPPIPLNKTKLNKTKLNKTKEDNGSYQLPEIEELVSEFLKLPGWGNSQLANDEEWLSEFLADFPGFSILQFKACRDHHLARSMKHTKGAWKSRLRNWMTNENKWRASAKGNSRGLPKEYTPQRDYGD